MIVNRLFRNIWLFWNQAADVNNRMRMFSVAGAHTFFMPVDTAFDTSVQLSGYVQLMSYYIMN